MKYVLLCCLAFPLFANACEDYALWKEVNKDCTWTNAAEKAVGASSLPTRTPTDIANFCPNYVALTTDRKNKFWVGLLSAVARPESNYKPETTYIEDFNDSSGKKVRLNEISRGGHKM